MTETRPISIRLDQNDYSALCSLAGEIQAERGESYSASEAVRDLIRGKLSVKKTPMLPINLGYKPIGRSLLDVVHMNTETDDIIRFRKNYNFPSYVTPKAGLCTQNIIRSDEILIPTFTISNNPTWKMDTTYKESEEDIVSRAIESLDRTEDLQVINAIKCCDKKCIYTKKLSFEDLSQARKSIIANELPLCNIVCHPNNEDLCCSWANSLEVNERHPRVRVTSSNTCLEQDIFLLSKPEFVGKFVIAHDTTILKDDRPCELMYGRVIWRHIGIGITSDCALVSIKELDVPNQQS